MNERWIELMNHFNDAEFVVIGVGNELFKNKIAEKTQIIELISCLSSYLEKKNYFIITSDENGLIENTGLNEKRIVRPMRILQNSAVAEENLVEHEKKQWDLYNKWLSCTINKKTLLIELGEGFQNPNLFRWPFEKITFINQKAKLYRINQTFPQVPENIAEKAVSINENPYKFMEMIRDYAILQNH